MRLPHPSRRRNPKTKTKPTAVPAPKGCKLDKSGRWRDADGHFCASPEK